MCPGLSADLQQMDDFRKTAIISKELTRLKVAEHSFRARFC